MIRNLSLIIILVFSSCLSRNKNQVFGASDELHSIKLFKNDNSFDIILNGVNTMSGTYKINNDTIKLIYKKDNNLSPKNLLIKNKKIKSIDNKTSFCADIYLNNLN